MFNVVFLVYLADVMYNLSGLFIFGLIAAIIYGAVFSIYTASRISDAYDSEERDKLRSGWKSVIKRAVISIALISTVMILLPSRTVIYTYGVATAIQQISSTPQGEQINSLVTDTISLLSTKIKELKDASGKAK